MIWYTQFSLVITIYTGLYRELDDTFRFGLNQCVNTCMWAELHVVNQHRKNYCKLWKAVISMDIDAISHYCKLLAGDKVPFQLFAAVLTARSWERLGLPTLQNIYMYTTPPSQHVCMAGLFHLLCSGLFRHHISVCWKVRNRWHQKNVRQKRADYNKVDNILCFHTSLLSSLSCHTLIGYTYSLPCLSCACMEQLEPPATEQGPLNICLKSMHC